jgi:hypothetical protein
MPTLDQVRTQIANLPHKYIFYTKKEIRHLPKILGDDEAILALTSGYRDGKTWLAVCTNRRLLLINSGMFFGLRIVQMNLDRIQSMDSSHVIFFGTIRFWDGASSVEINLVLKQSIEPFMTTTQQAIDLYKRDLAYGMANHVVKGGPKLTDELERLSRMKAAGMLSEEEFNSAKAKLLG